MIFHAGMDQPQPPTNPRQNSLARFYPWFLVLLVLLLVGFIRVRLLDMPLERDEGEYAYAGQLILQGIPPYTLVYNMKLPGTYFAYALGMALFGQTTAGIHLTLLLVDSLIIIFLFLLGRKHFSLVIGLVACATYAIIAVSPAVLGSAAHATHFVVLCAVPATLLLWSAAESKRWPTLFFSGLLYGLGFLMKQQGVCFCLFGCAFLIWQEWQTKPVSWPHFSKRCLIFGLGLILPFATLCLVLAALGLFAKFWFWTFTYASAYVASVSLADGIAALCAYLRQTLVIYFCFFILAAAGLFLGWRDMLRQKQMIVVTGFLFFSFFGTSIGLYFRPHYFILSLPALALLAGLGVESLGRALLLRQAKIISSVLYFAVFCWAIWVGRRTYFQMTPLQISPVLYQESPFVQSIKVAQYIREHSAKNASIVVLGSEPEIYFYAQRHSATGYIYAYALMEEHRDAPKMQREMIREIEQNKPEYLVQVGYKYSWLLRDSSDTEILDWMERYTKEFYQLTGLVNTGPDGKTVYLWDDAAKKYQGRLQQFLMIYRRQPAAAR